jgi:hypothetical protein
MKNGVLWDDTPCGSCKNRCFEELSASFIRVTGIGEIGTTLAVTSNRRTLRRRRCRVPPKHRFLQEPHAILRTENLGLDLIIETINVQRTMVVIRVQKSLTCTQIRAVPQLRRLFAGLLPWRRGFEPGSSQVWNLCWPERHRDRFSSSTFVSPYTSFIMSVAPQSSVLSSLSVIQGWYNRLINGLSNSGLGSIPAKVIK